MPQIEFYEFTNRLLVILKCLSVNSSKEITFRTKQIHKRRFFISANLFSFAERENRLLCICVFVFGLKKSQPSKSILAGTDKYQQQNKFSFFAGHFDGHADRRYGAEGITQ